MPRSSGVNITLNVFEPGCTTPVVYSHRAVPGTSRVLFSSVITSTNFTFSSVIPAYAGVSELIVNRFNFVDFPVIVKSSAFCPAPS